MLRRCVESALCAALCLAALLWLTGRYSIAIVEPGLPLVRATLERLDEDVDVLSLNLARAGPNIVLRLRADIPHPQRAQGGWVQVDLTLGGLLQYGILLLTIVAAWPARSVWQRCGRLLLSLPAAASLCYVATVTTLLAEVRASLHDAPGDPLLVDFSQFLMGGGGAMLAVMLAALIALATGKGWHGSSMWDARDSERIRLSR